MGASVANDNATSTTPFPDGISKELINTVSFVE